VGKWHYRLVGAHLRATICDTERTVIGAAGRRETRRSVSRQQRRYLARRRRRAAARGGARQL